MCRISADESPSVAKTVRDESAASPCLVGDYVILKVRSDAENRPNGPVVIDRIKLQPATRQCVADDPSLTSIDCDDISAAAGIERKIDPSGFSLQKLDKLGRANTG